MIILPLHKTRNKGWTQSQGCIRTCNNPEEDLFEDGARLLNIKLRTIEMSHGCP